MTQWMNGSRFLSHGVGKILRACRNFGKVNVGLCFGCPRMVLCGPWKKPIQAMSEFLDSLYLIKIRFRGSPAKCATLVWNKSSLLCPSPKKGRKRKRWSWRRRRRRTGHQRYSTSRTWKWFARWSSAGKKRLKRGFIRVRGLINQQQSFIKHKIYI